MYIVHVYAPDLQLSDAMSTDHEYSALYLATLYACIASELENDYLRAKASKRSSSYSRDDVIGKSDLIKPLFQETLHIACSYLHVALKASTQYADDNRAAVQCRKADVDYNLSEYLEILRSLVDDMLVDGEPKYDVYALKTPPQEPLTQQTSSKSTATTTAAASNSSKQTSALQSQFAASLIPDEFIQMVDARYAQFERFYLPREALLFTMTEEHLPPAFNARIALASVLDLVAARAHTNRNTVRAHLCVLDHAEHNHNHNISDPLVNKDVLQIMEYYSQNRLKAFYTDCYYALTKKTSSLQKRFSKRCGCSESLHLTVAASASTAAV